MPATQTITQNASALTLRYEHLYASYDANIEFLEEIDQLTAPGRPAHPMLHLISDMRAFVTRLEDRQDKYFESYLSRADDDDNHADYLRAICRIMSLEIALITKILSVLPQAEDIIAAHYGDAHDARTLH